MFVSRSVLKLQQFGTHYTAKSLHNTVPEWAYVCERGGWTVGQTRMSYWSTAQVMFTLLYNIGL